MFDQALVGLSTSGETVASDVGKNHGQALASVGRQLLGLRVCSTPDVQRRLSCTTPLHGDADAKKKA